nr:hypothetical protein [Xanthomonas floridensis]
MNSAAINSATHSDIEPTAPQRWRGSATASRGAVSVATALVGITQPHKNMRRPHAAGKRNGPGRSQGVEWQPMQRIGVSRQQDERAGMAALACGLEEAKITWAAAGDKGRSAARVYEAHS